MPATKSIRPSYLVGELVGGFFAVERNQALVSMLRFIPCEPRKARERITGSKGSKDEPCELLADASNAVGDLLVDTPSLLRVDFALAELLFDSIHTCEGSSLATLHQLWV